MAEFSDKTGFLLPWNEIEIALNQENMPGTHRTVLTVTTRKNGTIEHLIYPFGLLRLTLTVLKTVTFKASKQEKSSLVSYFKRSCNIDM